MRSWLSVCLIGVVLISYRLSYSDCHPERTLKVTTWDAFGYYMYLPSAFIYNDATELAWLPEIDSTYNLTGGTLYQSNIHTNGNYVNKYLGGVSIMQTPFFFVGHGIAKMSNYKADGFSPPYQYAIAFGAIFYCILALFILRKILLRFYDDKTTTLTLLFLALATNLIQYIAIDSAQSHAFILPLYAFVLYTTIKWHESPRIRWAALTGLIIGVATISRPTEAIMLFIPLLWGMNTKALRKEKWALVKANRSHVIFAVIFGIIGVLPQIIYWKMTSGSFIYDVGSKWFFLNPWFRVLFGFENGWFIYTPITIFFVIGFFFMKKFSFQRAVIVFCLLNIWIIIAWSDWKYGATYSTRAMVQSYPVFALAFGALVQRIETKKWKYFFYLAGLYLIIVNLFQIGQYNDTVLHYRDMNRQYYGRIYLNPNPSALDMSLLDTDEVLNDESDFEAVLIASSDIPIELSGTPSEPAIVDVTQIGENPKGWIKVEARINAQVGHNAGQLQCKIQSGDIVKERYIRLNNPICDAGESNDYAFYIKIPECESPTDVIIFVNSWDTFEAHLETFKVTYLKSPN